jgi:hypothetical protein
VPRGERGRGELILLPLNSSCCRSSSGDGQQFTVPFCRCCPPRRCFSDAFTTVRPLAYHSDCSVTLCTPNCSCSPEASTSAPAPPPSVVVKAYATQHLSSTARQQVRGRGALRCLGRLRGNDAHAGAGGVGEGGTAARGLFQADNLAGNLASQPTQHPSPCVCTAGLSRPPRRDTAPMHAPCAPRLDFSRPN